MRILVTGASGFIGNYVVKALLAQGHEVTATTRSLEKNKQKSWFSGVDCKELDLARIPDEVFTYLNRPERIIHLAWGGLSNYNDTIHTERNYQESITFLKKMIEQGANHLLVAGTCFEYGLTEGELTENTPPAPVTEYGKGKNMLRITLENTFKNTPVIFQWARLFYMYGEGQAPSSLYSQINKAIANKDKIFNMSKGDQIRDFLPVEQVAQKLVDLALSVNKSGIMNICSGNPRTVSSLVEDFFVAQGYSIELNKGYYPYPTYEPFAFWGKKTGKI